MVSSRHAHVLIAPYTHKRTARRDRHGAGEQGLGEAGDLVWGFALGAQQHEEGGRLLRHKVAQQALFLFCFWCVLGVFFCVGGWCVVQPTHEIARLVER